MMRRKWRLLVKDDGSNVIELAFLMPILLLLLAGAVDFGRAYYIAIEVNSAAHAGALYGSQNPMDTGGMIAAANRSATGITLQVAPPAIACECYDGAPATCGPAPNLCSSTGNILYSVLVKTSAIYKPIFSGIPGIPASITLSGQSSMRAAF
jgi:hypothetical protein